MSVQLVIKNPTNQIDFRMEVSLSSSVSDVKARLSAEYPNNPQPAQQKLIFAGKLLQDNDQLSEIFKQHDTSNPQTVHLVVRTAPPAATPEAQTNPAPATGAVPAPAPAPAPGPVPGMPQGVPPGFYPFPPQYMPPPGAGFQIHYQFGNNLHAHMHGANPGYPGFAMPPQAPNIPPPLNQQNQPQPPQPQPPRPANNNNNNPAADYLGLFAKLAVLVFILSQGGSTRRTILLCLGGLLVFLYQTGQFRWAFNLHVVRHPAPVPAPVPGAPAEQNQPAQEGVNPEVPLPPPQSPGIVTEIVNFFIPFFLSLFPGYRPEAQAA